MCSFFADYAILSMHIYLLILLMIYPPWDCMFCLIVQSALNSLHCYHFIISRVVTVTNIYHARFANIQDCCWKEELLLSFQSIRSEKERKRKRQKFILQPHHGGAHQPFPGGNLSTWSKYMCMQPCASGTFKSPPSFDTCRLNVDSNGNCIQYWL